jgi:hypothetical protein
MTTSHNNGGTTDCYAIPKGAKTLNDLIEHKGMTFAQGEIFKACYAMDERATRATDGSSSKLREANKMLYYAQRIVNQLQPKIRVKFKVRKEDENKANN